ncbi:tail fiber assembly protein [Pseudomonas sp. Marseille-Q5115]|uniref:tail fiber assembly protein n=1 Tax=Pseudomonas sp. Marseille-Q5115 TaxID=2866593 RepID=UPI001CE4B25F|nr:tail fiber assembly protein [Pseudomonas sp. Marseille-Q5115]
MKTYAVINQETGLVENLVVWDGESEWSPPEGFVAVETEAASIGWTYSEGQFRAPPVVPPSAEEIKANNTSIKDSLLLIAAAAIAPLQDAVDLDDATDAEMALLKRWKQYRVALSRLDLTIDPVAWPNQPE